MKYLVLITTILLSFHAAVAKTPTALDTIRANETMNVALFFPSEIRQGIVGSGNFVFTYDREKGQTLGLLKAEKGATSNLLVITVDGNVYSFIIEYASELGKLNHFINGAERIGNESEGPTATTKGDMKTPKMSLPTEKYTLEVKDPLPEETGSQVSKPISRDTIAKSCATLLEGPERFKRTQRKKGISLGVRNMVYYNDLIFVQYEVANRSGIDLDIASLELVRAQGKRGRRSAYQDTFLKPLHTYGMPVKVRHGDTVRFVRVYPKTTLGDGERFDIRLREGKGNREVGLKIKRPGQRN